MTHEIRPATPQDVPAMVAMVSALAQHHKDTPSVTAAALTNDLFGQRPWISALIAQIDGKPVGYAILCPLYRAQYGLRGMDLHHLFVIPSFRSRGLGSALVRASLDQAEQQGCAYFVVAAAIGNKSAQAFYQSLGFTQTDSTSTRFAYRF